jgi:hypothetical protein
LYQGEGTRALERVDRTWDALADTLLLRIQHTHLSALILRASSALAAATTAADPEPLLERVESDAREIVSIRAPWAVPVASLYRAALASRRGAHGEAVSHLESAILEFGRHSMGLYEQVASRRLGRLLGGDAGATTIASAERWMVDHGVADPEGVSNVLGPGF